MMSITELEIRVYIRYIILSETVLCIFRFPIRNRFRYMLIFIINSGFA
ncbi:hypothetical protein LOK49_LG01G01178 [Camellia lanceoleosa]|uniref:Uncharacterized protein n=1 Tax=Camellia lanceoleosa TaxID=1840588 RepID=A0ACC0J1D5_9ERIC|nr:hypothetical protein LOK49_LG01G01178 [Camellia lanceoleosa]